MNRREERKADKLFPAPTHQVFIPVGGGLWAAVLSRDEDFVTLGPEWTRNEVAARAAAYGYEPVFIDDWRNP